MKILWMVVMMVVLIVVVMMVVDVVVSMEWLIKGFALWNKSDTFVGNLVTSSILKSPNLDMKRSFRHILLMLAMFDTSFSLLASLTFSMPLLSTQWHKWVHPYTLPFLLPGRSFKNRVESLKMSCWNFIQTFKNLFVGLQIALNGSIWSTVMVAIERYVSIGQPSQR